MKKLLKMDKDNQKTYKKIIDACIAYLVFLCIVGALLYNIIKYGI